jgi:hypothetical protein
MFRLVNKEWETEQTKLKFNKNKQRKEATKHVNKQRNKKNDKISSDRRHVGYVLFCNAIVNNCKTVS